jgi:hypothetical protein
LDRHYYKNLPSPLFAKEGYVSPFGKGGQEGFYKSMLSFNLRLLIIGIYLIIGIWLLMINIREVIRCSV